MGNGLFTVRCLRGRRSSLVVGRVGFRAHSVRPGCTARGRALNPTCDDCGFAGSVPFCTSCPSARRARLLWRASLVTRSAATCPRRAGPGEHPGRSRGGAGPGFDIVTGPFRHSRNGKAQPKALFPSWSCLPGPGKRSPCLLCTLAVAPPVHVCSAPRCRILHEQDPHWYDKERAFTSKTAQRGHSTSQTVHILCVSTVCSSAFPVVLGKPFFSRAGDAEGISIRGRDWAGRGGEGPPPGAAGGAARPVPRRKAEGGGGGGSDRAADPRTRSFGSVREHRRSPLLWGVRVLV